MNKIAEFQKISYEQFSKDIEKLFPAISEEERKIIYQEITLPVRSTSGSAGYDIRSPIGFVLLQGETITIPTGVRCKIDDGWFLMIAPRSGFGFKYRIQLDNTIGIIDSDYYNSTNEGHIIVKITNDSKVYSALEINSGDRIVQSIFVPYGITYDDKSDGVRDGGFGSSGAS